MSYGTATDERPSRADVQAAHDYTASPAEREAAAVEALEADAEKFSEWVSVHCLHQTDVTFSNAPRKPEAFADFVLTLSPAELLAYALQHALAYPANCAACMELLRSKYVTQHMRADGWTGEVY